MKYIKRFIFLQKHHYHELPIEAQTELGEIPEKFTDYWTHRFPQLLLHTWLSMQCIKSEPAFRRYYFKDYIFEYSLEIGENIIYNLPETSVLVQNTRKKFDYLKYNKNKNKNDGSLNYDWRQEKQHSPENATQRKRNNNNQKFKKRLKSDEPVTWLITENN